MKKAEFFYNNANAPIPNRPNHIGACAIIRFGNEIVMEKRKDSERWALIGGGLKINESLETCICREIMEETGITACEDELIFHKIFSDPSRIVSYPDGNIVRIITATYSLYLNEKFETTCSSESTEVRYINIEELCDYDIVETHNHIINEIILSN